MNEIARAAGVANGAFYVHFRDKYEMASIVSLAWAAEIARQPDEDMRDVDCAIQRVVCATRRFLQIATRPHRSDEETGPIRLKPRGAALAHVGSFQIRTLSETFCSVGVFETCARCCA